MTITLWPGFSDRIPVYDARIDLTVSQPLPVETASPGPGGSGTPAGSTVPAPSTSPGESGGGEPSGGAAAPSAAP